MVKQILLKQAIPFKKEKKMQIQFNDLLAFYYTVYDLFFKTILFVLWF